jgi:hypothetical protein
VLVAVALLASLASQSASAAPPAPFAPGNDSDSGNDVAVGIGGVVGAVVVGGAYVTTLLVLDEQRRSAASDAPSAAIGEGATYGQIALFTWFVPTSVGALLGGILGHELHALSSDDDEGQTAQADEYEAPVPKGWHE